MNDPNQSMRLTMLTGFEFPNLKSLTTEAGALSLDILIWKNIRAYCKPLKVTVRE